MSDTATNNATPAPAEGTPAATNNQAPVNQQTQGAPAPGTQQTTVETPKVDSGAPGAASSEPAKAPEPAAPYEITPPDGAVVDSGVVKEFAAQAHRNGISKDVAQKILNDLAPTIAAREQENAKARVEQWKAEAAADKRLADPVKVDSRIDRAVAKLGTPELGKLLADSGLRHHPEFRAFFAAAGDAVSEDATPVRGAPSVQVTRVGGMTTTRDAAAIMYGRKS